MLDKMKGWVFGILLKKYALGGLVKVWNGADGYRTQLSMGVAAGVIVLGNFGYIPMDKAMEMAQVIGGTAIATFLEKLRKHQDLIVKVSDMVKEAQLEAKPAQQ